jgi:hypothetical protein
LHGEQMMLPSWLESLRWVRTVISLVALVVLLAVFIGGPR